MTDMTHETVVPFKLRGGDWGVRSTFRIERGDRVRVRTRTGGRFDTWVSRIVWTDGAAWIASTQRNEPEPRPSEPRIVALAPERPSYPDVIAFDDSGREVGALGYPLPAIPSYADALDAAAAFADEEEEEEAPATERTPLPEAAPCGRRPRPRVFSTTPAELAEWEPEKREALYVDENGTLTRAGEQYAIVRRGTKFPLGHSSDHRRIVSHNATRRNVLQGPVAAGVVDPGPCYVAGPGYFTAQTFDVRHMQAATVDGCDVTHHLVVTNDHTGAGAMRASIVLYVGLDAVGAVATAKGRHVASSPERFASDVDAMIETAVLKQDEVIELLRRAAAWTMTDEDRRFLRRRQIIVKKSARTALDAFRAWHSGERGRARPTWGVWARRLDDKGLRALDLLMSPRRKPAEEVDALLAQFSDAPEIEEAEETDDADDNAA